LITSDQRNFATYGLLTVDIDHQDWGRLKVLESLKSVKDNIPDNLLQWDSRNTLRDSRNIEVLDPLLARDALYNSFFIGHTYQPLKDLTIKNSLKYDLWDQRMGDAARADFGLGNTEFFFGIINKADYLVELSKLRVLPRWKSEYRRQTYDLFTTDDREELTEIFGTVVELPVMRRTTIAAGVEYVLFRDLDTEINNFQSFITAAQVTNVAEYQGYVLTTQVGLKFDARDFEDPDIKTRTVTEGFITVYAGLGI